MRSIIFIFSLFFGSTFAYAEKYLVERPDGSVAIINYLGGSNDSFADVVRDLGFTGFPIERLDESDLPATREDRKYWRLNAVPIGAKIKIDTAAKATDQAQEATDLARRNTLATKMGVTPAEMREARDLGLFR